MASGDEVVSPLTDDRTPLPGAGGAVPPSAPTPATLLAWIAAAGGQPWFPSRHAADTGTDRDALDEPLNRLRVAGLVRVATWVRGVGQGYVLTPDGEIATATGAGVPEDSSDSTAEAPPAIPDDPPSRPVFTVEVDPRPAVVVPVLFVANLLWFFVGLVIVLRAGLPAWPYLSEGDPEVLHRIGAVTGADLLRGEWWRLASSCFVHIGAVHLLFNLFALAMVGPLAEVLWGRRRFAVIYLLAGLAGSALAMALKPDSLLAGASGAIWGVLMSLVAWFVLFRRHLLADVVEDSTRRLTVVIVLNAMFSFMPGISWQGHLGGAVAGFVTAVLLNAMRLGKRRRRAAALALLLAFVAGCVGGLVVAMERGGAWVAYRQKVAGEKTREAAEAARVAYNRDVVPLLLQLQRTQPLTKTRSVMVPLLWFEINVPVETGIGRVEIDPDELKAVYQLSRPGARRNPDRVAQVRAKFAERKAAADAALGHLAAPPVGDEALDRHLERARAYAEARSRWLGLVLAMLDSPAVPDAAAWAAWGGSRRTADALWEQLTRR
jgi:membrane associated rhomboid family serine protease